MLPGLILLFNQKTLNPGVHWTVIACFYQLVIHNNHRKEIIQKGKSKKTEIKIRESSG